MIPNPIAMSGARQSMAYKTLVSDLMSIPIDKGGLDPNVGRLLLAEKSFYSRRTAGGGSGGGGSGGGSGGGGGSTTMGGNDYFILNYAGGGSVNNAPAIVRTNNLQITMQDPISGYTPTDGDILVCDGFVWGAPTSSFIPFNHYRCIERNGGAWVNLTNPLPTFYEGIYRFSFGLIKVNHLDAEANSILTVYYKITG